MSDNHYLAITKKALWQQNPALVQLLGLCPVLAVSNNTVNALSLGLATSFVVMCTSFLVSLCRHWVKPEIRVPVFILLIASLVSCVDLLMNAFLYQLYIILGIFIPLITTNCIVLARAEAFASKESPFVSAFDGALMGLGLTWVLVLLGSLRELIGSGSLFKNADLLFGEFGHHLYVQFTPTNYQFLIAILPTGAFFVLAFLVAAKNKIDQK